jgi:hypothetical protein
MKLFEKLVDKLSDFDSSNKSETKIRKKYREKLCTVLEDFNDGISHRSLCVSCALYRGWEDVSL